ncbi:MAG TPA: hypothetical protein VEJ38_16830 [Candidatus Acidoferrales bacterium]|nr:hypothetical protein [Candidatus Acidoferrales bacterium]
MAVCLAGLLASCEQQLNYPTPSLKSMNPTSITAGQPGFTLTVTGGNFTPASSVLWNGSPRNTLFGGTTTLTAQVLSTDIQNAGQAMVEVNTPQPGGGVTTPLTFTINPAPSPVPQITGLNPAGVFAGSAGIVLTVMGTNFASAAIVTVNDNARSTNFENSTALQAAILASDVAQAGTLQIAVLNPQPQGGASNSFPFTVKNQTPSITSLSPVAFTAGSAGGTLTVTGTNFVPNSVIYINGASRTTSFTSSTSVSVALNSGDVAQGGVDTLTVVNPAPGGGSSNLLTFAVNPTPLAGLPVILDLAPDGSQANQGICGTPSCTGTVPTLTTAGPVLSESGQFAAFASTSTNLEITQGNTVSNIFLRSNCLATTTTANASCSPITFRVSQTPNNTDANGSSYEPSIDSTGAHVAYTSTATNLVNYADVTSGTRQVYWQPTCASTGVTGCTGSAGAAALVSAAPDDVTPGNGDSYNPVISPDGQYVAFVSLATNLVSNVSADGITPQVYIRNTCNLVPPAAGSCNPVTYLVSTSDGITPGNAASSDPAVSNTGLFVAFVSTATNLGATASNPGGNSEVFVRSTCVTTISEAGNGCAPVTTLASTPDGTTPADNASSEPSISSDGRFVAFASTADTLIAGVGPTQEIYVRDTCTGVTSSPACAPSTQLISTPDGTTPANASSENPSVNSVCTTSSTTTACAAGQYVAFASMASNLGGNTQNGVENIFVRDTCNGTLTSTTTTTALCSTYTFLSSQPAGVSPPPSNGASLAPSLSGDGNTVAFISSATNLVPRDTNALPDFFLAGANLIFNLTVTLQGTGSGTVTDGTGQIDCIQTAATNTTPLTRSGTCTARYASGTTVTLTATATSPSTFTAWGGTAPNVTNASCTVTSGSTTSGTCSFGEIADNTATANFK